MADAAVAEPPTWTIQGRHGTMLLFGAVHVLPPGLDWQPKALTDAVRQADEIWFELPIGGDSDVKAAALISRRGLLPKGAGLSSWLTSDEQQRLWRAAGAMGVAPGGLQAMRPWLAEITLSLAIDTRAGADVANGVERYIQAIAPATARRRAFETADDQVGFLAGESFHDQRATLELTLTEIETQPDSYRRTLNAWLAGDLQTLMAEDLDPLRSAAPAAYRRLISDRNRRWVKILERRLKGAGKVVVVVGMGHLIGQDGVPALLRAAGYAVTGP